MKFSYIISIIILFSTSCNKEEDSTTDYHYDPTWSVESNYYFKGIIKDTSSNISLINCHYLANTCNYSKTDTIKDSTYFYHYRKIGSKYPCRPRPTLHLKNLSDSTIYVFYFPDSLKKLEDTVTLNIYF